MLIKNVLSQPTRDGYSRLVLLTNRGRVQCRYYPAPGTSRGVIFVGGTGGGWDSPANEFYPQLCADLAGRGIAALRVRYRFPKRLQEASLDVLAGLGYLQTQGIEAAGLVGHSFGGAVVIQAAATCQLVRTVVTLATQSLGTDPVAELSPRCSILLVHGEADTVLPPYCSEWAYFVAGDPKRLVLYEGAGHGLDEVSGALTGLVSEWLADRLP